MVEDITPIGRLAGAPCQFPVDRIEHHEAEAGGDPGPVPAVQEKEKGRDAQDRADLKNDIESTELPLLNVDANVGNNQVDVKLSGGYAGLRAMGFTFGFRF